jgi:hypothetical protein
MAVSDYQSGRDFTEETAVPPRLKIDRKFLPCPVEEGDEAFRNGIFELNITRLLAFIDAHAERFPVYLIAVAEISDFGGSHLDEQAVRAADLSLPVLHAEIAPGHYNLIDGNHRIAKARLDGVPRMSARRISCPEQIPFLTSTFAYEKYVEYWNSKLPKIRSAKA